MKILLFGGSGQLGHEVRTRALDLNFEVVAPVPSEVDVVEMSQVQFLTSSVKPDTVINCAAYTAVDKAEEERELAYRVNRDGVRNIARAAKEVGARVIHISTDYVFSGEFPAGVTPRPLREDDPTDPRNVYGASKLEGEQALLEELGDRGLVVRTSSLHGQHGENFVHTMLKLMREREVVKVVNDHIMSPTWAGWLAEVLLDLCRLELHGVVHASCAGAISWFDFAAGIREQVAPASPEVAKVRLEPIRAEEFGRPAHRPPYSVFDCSRLSAALGRQPIPWQEGLRRHLIDLGLCKSDESAPLTDQQSSV